MFGQLSFVEKWIKVFSNGIENLKKFENQNLQFYQVLRVEDYDAARLPGGRWHWRFGHTYLVREYTDQFPIGDYQSNRIYCNKLNRFLNVRSLFQFYNDFKFKSKIRSMVQNDTLPQIRSSGNTMSIGYFSSPGYRGFKAHYSASAPARKLLAIFLIRLINSENV